MSSVDGTRSNPAAYIRVNCYVCSLGWVKAFMLLNNDRIDGNKEEREST